MLKNKISVMKYAKQVKNKNKRIIKMNQFMKFYLVQLKVERYI